MTDSNPYPEGDALAGQVARRHRSGRVWRSLFRIATVVGIIALALLLYNVLNQAFGFGAVQNSVDPKGLLMEYQQVRMLGAGGVSARNDEASLAAEIAGNPYAIGLVRYPTFQDHDSNLKPIAVDGILPGGQETTGGRDSYSLNRPLFMYASPAASQPDAAAFVSFFLARVAEQSGVDATTAAQLSAARQAWLAANGWEMLPSVEPERLTADITIAASPSTELLVQRAVDQFMAEGYGGDVLVQTGQSVAGLQSYCELGTADIAFVSREMRAQEREACHDADKSPVRMPIGSEALAVVASQQNRFLEGVSIEELRQILTTAGKWSDINEAWPDDEILRVLPGAHTDNLEFLASSLFTTELADMPKDVLVGMLGNHITSGAGRALEREQRFFENYLVFDSLDKYLAACAAETAPGGCTGPARTQQDVYRLVLERVVEPEVIQTWSLVDSVFSRSEVLAAIADGFPGAEPQFLSWLTPTFVASPQNSEPELAGVRTAILGSLWVILITVLFSFPVGVGAAIYLEEYAAQTRLNQFIQTNINNLAGVPSIIYGILGLAIFVRLLEALTSGSAFGVTDPTSANGRTVLSAGLTLGLLILPIIIINSQEAIRAVPPSLRQASYGLGATRWQTVWSHVLPNALPGILTGTILAMSRAIGETAPLVVVGASTFITADPEGPFAKFTTLPIQIYQWTSRPQAEFRNIAAAAIIVLLALLLTLNASAVVLRNRFNKRLG